MATTAPLTDTRLRSLKHPAQRIHLPDGQVRGLVLRVTPAGTKTWALECRVRGAGEYLTSGKRAAGAKRRITLGEYPSMSIADARAKAAGMLALARRGEDPAPAPAPPPAKEMTVKDLITRYADQHLHRNLRSGAMVHQLLSAHVEPVWGTRPVSEIRRGDLVRLLEATRVKKPRTATGMGIRINGGPVAASNVRKWVTAMWNWGVGQDIVPDNPLERVSDPDRQKPRSRYLTMEEARAVWAAIHQLRSPWREFYQLVLLTGQRRDEWASARWSWLDRDLTRLEIPPEHYKTGRPQVVPLSAQVRDVIRSIPRHNGGPYLLSTDGGEKPISGFSKAKEQLDNCISVASGSIAFVVHDLRRTVATHMERLGVEPHVIEACLGHSLRGIERVYRHFTYYDQKAAALQKWADEVTRE